MISHIDHIVLTVSGIDRTMEFYTRVLEMEAVTFANGRKALRFGNQKINLQTLGQESRNNAGFGSGDICLITSWPMQKLITHLDSEHVEILEGPVEKTGATGKIMSVYFNDPDNNLIEVSTYE